MHFRASKSSQQCNGWPCCACKGGLSGPVNTTLAACMQVGKQATCIAGLKSGMIGLALRAPCLIPPLTHFNDFTKSMTLMIPEKMLRPEQCVQVDCSRCMKLAGLRLAQVLLARPTKLSSRVVLDNSA